MKKNNDIVLARLDTARRALAEAKTIQETKKIVDVAAAAEILAKRQKLGEEAVNYATSIKVEALAQLGRMLKEMPKNKGTRGQLSGRDISGGTEIEPPEDTTPTLADMGLDKKTSKLAQDIARLPDKQIEAVKQGVLSLSRAVSNNHISDDSFDWYTPLDCIESAKLVMGNITTDPASSEVAQKKIMAEVYYTKETNGLNKSWKGNVWLNPPYSFPEIDNFIKKLLSEINLGNCKQAIVLTNNSTDTLWFHSLLNYPFCITKGRLSFWNKNGEKLAARQGQMFFYIGKNEASFITEFSKYGAIVKRI